MSITRSFNVLFILTALLLSCILTAFAAQREYQVALERLLEGSLARVMAHPDLQIHISNRDESRLKNLLQDFLDPAAATKALAYNNELKELASAERDQTSPTETPPLRSIRSDMAVAETGWSAFDGLRQPTGTGFLSSLAGETSLLYMTTPVLSSLEPATGQAPPEDILGSLRQSRDTKSQNVLGYIAVVIDRDAVLQSIRPAISRAFITSLVVLLLCALAFYLAARWLTRPVATLKQAALKVAAGDSDAIVNLKGNSEFNHIGNAFNLLLKQVDEHKKQLDLEKQILAKNADKTASELSEREEALSRAASEIDDAKKQLHQLAHYDRLTGLPNRKLFTTQLDLLLRLSARSKKPLALMCLNLNDFHRVNESLGHSTGDIALSEVGKRLVGCLRDSDMLAHQGKTNEYINISRVDGDEFVMVLNDLDSAEAAEPIAQRIVDALKEPMTIEGHELVVNPSIGIAVAPRDGTEVESLLRSANAAMQHAESTRQSSIVFYSAEIAAGGQDDLKLELELRKSLERNELHLHYQPQVDTHTGAIICAEALVRWDHPELGNVSPGRFIPLAERIGLIGQLGDWVLAEACRQMKEFKIQGNELPRMAINVSPQQLNSDFVRYVQEVLQTMDLPPSSLELGLSEGILMASDSSTLQLLQELKELGVYLSLENFGTNYATLGYLSRCPLDDIKLDRSFISDCDKREESARLVLAIIAMARSLNLDPVAEGVESEEEFRFLASNNVRVMRGYLFSKPVPAPELQQLLVAPWHYMNQVQRMSMDTSKL